MSLTLQQKRERYHRAHAPVDAVPASEFNPYAILLDHTPWQIFLTGTLKTEQTSEKLVRLCWWSFLQEAASRLGYPSRGGQYQHFCDYFVRLEKGEMGERWHLHALIRIPNRRPTKRLAFALKAIWQAIPSAGISRTRLVNSGVDAGSSTTLVDYLCKLGENNYEAGKFPGAESFIISRTLLPTGVYHARTQLR